VQSKCQRPRERISLVRRRALSSRGDELRPARDDQHRRRSAPARRLACLPIAEWRVILREEARAGLVPASVFKTDDALREQRHGGFDSHAFPPFRDKSWLVPKSADRSRNHDPATRPHGNVSLTLGSRRSPRDGAPMARPATPTNRPAVILRERGVHGFPACPSRRNSEPACTPGNGWSQSDQLS
jgi:hypothetical protein